jgi:ferredoxin-NADP reductase
MREWMMNVERSDPMLPHPYRIQRVRHEIPETFTLDLVPEGGGNIPPFATGQFNML